MNGRLTAVKHGSSVDGKRRKPVKAGPQKVVSVVFDSIAIRILVTEMPTGKMTLVESTCLGPNLWALGIHLQLSERLSPGAVSTHRASGSKFLVSLVSYHSRFSNTEVQSQRPLSHKTI